MEMMNLYRLTRPCIAVVAVCAFTGWLAVCAQPGSLAAGGEGSSLPPSQNSVYVFPPPALQVYD